MTVLETLPAQRGVTLLVVTHNRAVAARADTRLALDAGRLSHSGAPMPSASPLT
jgi:predicted ABC-type transport system involved in lysophospholipase L1 biosynthesis ATPase subunit